MNQVQVAKPRFIQNVHACNLLPLLVKFPGVCLHAQRRVAAGYTHEKCRKSIDEISTESLRCSFNGGI